MVLFDHSYDNGGLAPASPVVITSPEWTAIEASDAANPAKAWAAGPGKDYETFNRYAYAFDVVVPLIDLGQEAAWLPSASRPAGEAVWWMRWVLKIAGWIVAALGAAAITGIIRRE